MPASSKILRPSGLSARQQRYFAPGLAALGFAALLSFAAFGSAGLGTSASSPGAERGTLKRTAAVPSGSVWAGGLETPQAEAQAAGSEDAPITSAAYTSGFDRTAAGLDPLPAGAPAKALVQPHDPRSCPNDLNCTFRPVKAGAVPPRRPIVANAQPSKDTQPASGFNLLTANLHLPVQMQLPYASTLMKPFTFVGNTVAGLAKKL